LCLNSSDPCQYGSRNTQNSQRGLPGYLILFAPHAFALQRQYKNVRDCCLRPWYSVGSATGITPTSDVIQSFTYSRIVVLKAYSGLSPEISLITNLNRLEALYAQLVGITLAPLVLPRLLARS